MPAPPHPNPSVPPSAPRVTGHATPAIEVVGLRKAFGEHVVLAGVDLTVEAGTVFALLGPNGSGKTTMIHLLTTLLRPDAGTARVAGHDVVAEPDAVRHAIGVTGQFAAVDSLLTGEENLRLMADLAHLGRDEGRRRVADLLARFDLLDAARTPLSTYSGGMRRRLDLAMTLVGDPQIIFLDEPTTGLDPRSRHTMWDLVRDLVRDGVTIFLTTQYLDEADRLADRIAVLDGGVVVAEGTPGELKSLVPGGHLVLRFDDPDDLDRTRAALGGDAGPADPAALTLQVPGDGGIPSLRAVLARLDEAAVTVADLSIHTPDLDDVFFALTARDPEETASHRLTEETPR